MLSIFSACFSGVYLYQKKTTLELLFSSLQSTAILTILAFSSVVYSFISSDMTVKLVFQHSSLHKPLFYKIAGLWGNHEGSMLLWVTLLSLFGLLCIKRREAVQPITLSILFQSLLLSLFLIYTLFFANPFLRNDDFVMNGLGMNPALQDPSMMIHPPILYMGSITCALIFILSLSTLITQNTAFFIRLCKPLIWLAFTLLSAGIALGSFWAYYELGWGGFWFWDPVENIALIPWIFIIILLHMIPLTHKKTISWVWPLFIGLMAFISICAGLYTTRSGLLVSVHAFALDPMASIFLAFIFMVIGGGSIILWLYYAPLLPISQKRHYTYKPLLFAHTFLFMLIGLLVIIGTFYPFIAKMVNPQNDLFLDADFFNKIFIPLILVSMIATTLMPVLKDKRHLFFYGFCTILTLILALFWPLNFIERIAVFASSLMLMTNLKMLSRNTLSMILAHSSIAVMALGITLYHNGKGESIYTLTPGVPLQLGEKTLILNNVVETDHGDYLALKAHLTLDHHTITPEKRFYRTQKKIAEKVGLSFFGLHHYYAVLGGKMGDSWQVRLAFHPFINLLWIGAIMLILSGIIHFIRRRRPS